MVGILSAEDPDQPEGHDFALIEGDGINDADNDLFSIHGDSLIINTSPDYETRQEYSIYVQATDDDSKTLDKAIIIYVNDVPESDPTSFTGENIMKSSARIYPNPASGYMVLEYEADEAGTLSVDLFDVKGSYIQSIISDKALLQGNNKIGIVLNEHIPAGTYILVISNKISKQSILIHKN